MFKLYLFHNKIQKGTETHGTHFSAFRSGQNWEMLRKGNTFTILEWEDKRSKKLKGKLAGLGTVDADTLLIGCD